MISSFLQKCFCRGIDDPIGACSVHLLGGICGEISVGLFAHNPLTSAGARSGLFMGMPYRRRLIEINNFKVFSPTGGGYDLLIIQMFSVTCLFFWGLIITYPILWCVNKLIPIRLSPEEEILGCDVTEHFMGEEHEKLVLSQISNIKLGTPQVIFSSPPNDYNETYKEFDTLGKRRTYHLNQGFDPENAAHTTNRL